MRIISPFHDYYDTALGLGYDPSQIYRREVAVRNVRAVDLDSKISTLFSEACQPYRFESKLAIIGFCGRVYPVCLFPSFIPSPELLLIKHPKSLAMSRTELSAYHKELYGSDRAWYERSYGKKTWDVLDKQGLQIRQESFQLIEAPIWLAMIGEYEWNEAKMIRIYTNVRLANFEFQKHFDAFTAFQEVSMFFGSALAKTDESVRTVGSDEVIAAQKGFGPESFRTNAPSVKKYRRKENRARKKGEGN